MKRIKNLLLLFMCGCVYMFLAIGSTSTNVSTSNTDSGTQVATNEISTYKLNEDIFITNNLGKYRLKFTNIYESNDRNQFSDTKADRVVVIEYEYENMTLTEDLNISDWNFKPYDKDNNKLETYPIDTKYGGTVSTGRKTTGSVAYALNNDNNYIELEYYDNTWNSKADCKVVFEW